MIFYGFAALPEDRFFLWAVYLLCWLRGAVLEALWSGNPWPLELAYAYSEDHSGQLGKQRGCCGSIARFGCGSRRSCLPPLVMIHSAALVWRFGRNSILLALTTMLLFAFVIRQEREAGYAAC